MNYFNESQSLEVLRKLISFNTVGNNEEDVAYYIQELLAKYDIKSQIIDVHGNRANLVAEIGHGQPVLGLTGHMDVVDPGNLEAWNTNPFELTEKNGTLYGRGVCDMKSGLAAMIIAMIELHKQGLPKQGTIRLLACMSEEIGEVGSHYLLEDGLMNDVDGLIVGEPAGYNIFYSEKGSMDIKVTSKGKTSHSSMPEFGYNAIDALMNFLIEANNNFRRNPIKQGSMGPLVFNTTTIKGGTQVNSIPDYAEADVNVRTIPEYTNQQVIDVLNQMVTKFNKTGAQIGFDVYMNEKPVGVAKDNILVELTHDLMKKYTDDKILVVPNPGITDASNLVQGKSHDFPFIIAGPGNLTSHKVNEEMDKQMYFNYIDIYEELTVKFLSRVVADVKVE